MAVTQEQIDKGRELNQKYKSGEITAQEAQNQMADELYARDPTKLQNADVNVNKYGDDHTEQNYNNSDLWGGENSKYTGENTKNSYTAYDPNATVEGLDPNYQYGKNAQMANSQNENYIANRNDQIASALYNEGKTSIEDVANFLRTQRGFENSTENERQNTINSIWKRLGQMAKENESENTDNQNDQALANMENDLLKSTEGKLYGKVTADEGETTQGITTLEDPYNVDRAMAESRIKNLKNLQAMDSQSIAASIISGTTPYGEQAMRDLMQYNPTKYQEVQTAIKQLKGQQTINSITNGEGDTVSLTSTAEGDMTQFAENNANDTTSAGQILKDVKSTLESNTAANSAQETMDTIENDIARLQNRLKNLKKEASQVFKGDVPQYIVNAYISNRTAEIQDELSILESRWNAANERYTRELAHSEWEEEMKLKRDQLQLDRDSLEWKKYMDEQGLGTNINSNLTRGERNNNPTNMTVNYLKLMGAIEGVDYENSGDYFVDSNGNKLYYGTLLGDPIETQLRIWDRAVENGKNPFTKGSYSYVEKIGITPEKWKALSDEEKRNILKQFMQYEGVNADNLLYYRNLKDQSYTNDYGQTFNLTSYSGWNSLTAEEQALVKQALNLQYDITTLPKGGADNGKSYRNVLAAVTTIDPAFKTRDYKIGSDVAKKWAVSKQAGGEASRNATSMAIIKELWNSYDKLKNRDLQLVNNIVNWGKTQVGDPTVVGIETNIEIAAEELAGALKGNASPTDENIKAMRKLLSGKLSSEQFEQVLSNEAKALYEKNNTEAYGFYQDVGYKPAPIWTPEVADWMVDELGINLSLYYNYVGGLPDEPIGDGDTYE